MLQVILLIYEYSIVVESSLVQRRRNAHKYNDTVVINDTPVADRLDRTYFGFDQDYFEQMPLLVNAMQENSYIDPTIEIPSNSKDRDRRLKYPNFTTEPTVHTSTKNSVIRRTSPRPFIFEYRSPTPVPFHKNYNSRSWIDSYRNAQRLKNLEQVISYLEKTINAKFGDLYPAPSTAQVTFSGVYVQPTNEVKPEQTTSWHDLIPQSSINSETFKKHIYNHQSDPYFNFKPESPGDVNLLADVPLKFSPSNQLPNYNSFTRLPYKIPMFRPITRLKGCVGPKCRIQSSEEKSVQIIPIQGSGEMNTSENLFHQDKPKSFSVLLNLFSMTPAPNNYYKKQDATTHRPFDKIYITTPNPHFQFRRKSTSATSRRTNYMRRFKRPLKPETKSSSVDSYSNENISNNESGAKMILHFNVFPKDGTTSTTATDALFTPSTEIPSMQTTKQTSAENVNDTPFIPTHTPFIPTPPPNIPTCPSELCPTNVEDYHAGSSGVIPVELRTFPTTSLPQATTVIPFLDSAMTSSDESKTWSTSPPEIIKFSKEDAKIPEEYNNFRQYQEGNQSTVTRKSSHEDEYDIKGLEEQSSESAVTRVHQRNPPATRQSYKDHFGNFRLPEVENQSAVTRRSSLEEYDNFSQSVTRRSSVDYDNFSHLGEETIHTPVTRKSYYADNTQSPVTGESIHDPFTNFKSKDDTQRVVIKKISQQDKDENVGLSEEIMNDSPVTRKTTAYYADNTQSPIKNLNFEDHFNNFKASEHDTQSEVTRKNLQQNKDDNVSEKEENMQPTVTRRSYYADRTQSPITEESFTDNFNKIRPSEEDIESAAKDDDDNSYNGQSEGNRQTPVKTKNYSVDDDNESPVTRRSFRDHFNDEDKKDGDRRTLIVKLKNYLDSTTVTPEADEVTEGQSDEPAIEETKKEVLETTTFRTYVPQINGHYRSVNQNSKNINSWLSGNSESKRKLEITTANGIKKPTLTYVEIKRNRNYADKNNEKES